MPPSDLPETQPVPTTAIERLAYAGGRVAGEVADLRESVDKLRADVAPALDEYRLELAARRDERTAFAGARTKFWKALSQPAVIVAVVGAMLAGLGVGSNYERAFTAAMQALTAPAPGTTTIEVHDAAPAD